MCLMFSIASSLRSNCSGIPFTGRIFTFEHSTIHFHKYDYKPINMYHCISLYIIVIIDHSVYSQNCLFHCKFWWFISGNPFWTSHGFPTKYPGSSIGCWCHLKVADAETAGTLSCWLHVWLQSEQWRYGFGKLQVFGVYPIYIHAPHVHPFSEAPVCWISMNSYGYHKSTSFWTKKNVAPSGHAGNVLSCLPCTYLKNGAM